MEKFPRVLKRVTKFMKPKLQTLFICFILLSLAQKTSAQAYDSIVIITSKRPTSEAGYAWVNFSFFDFNSKKQIMAAAVNIHGVKIVSDATTGSVKVALLPDKYNVWISSPFFISSKIFTLKTKIENEYQINVYLSPSNNPLHPPLD